MKRFFPLFKTNLSVRWLLGLLGTVAVLTAVFTTTQRSQAGEGGDSALFLPFVLGGGGNAGGDVTLTAVPDSVTSDRHATFQFVGDGDGFECALNGGAFAACSSPHVLLNLMEGAQQFAVRVAGSDTAASHDWRIDSVFALGDSGLQQHGILPGDDPNGGAFRIKCEFSHANYDDPIVFPNEANRAHLHSYFGNTLSDAFSDIPSMVTTGESTCQGGILNRSSYWAPSLLFPLADGGSGYGFVATTDGAFATDIYYKTAVDDTSTIQPLPDGLRMIAGDGGATTPQENNVVRWSCDSWIITSGDDFLPHVPRCSVGDMVRLSIAFPSCWDGNTLYSADQSHMAYPTVSPNGSGGWVHHCPASHSVPLPIISYNFAYPVTAANAPLGDSRDWKLSSDQYEISDATPGGYSAHGDWFMAWHPEIVAAFVENCLQPGRDCANGDLGNGWRLAGMMAGSGEIPPIEDGLPLGSFFAEGERPLFFCQLPTEEEGDHFLSQTNNSAWQ